MTRDPCAVHCKYGTMRPAGFDARSPQTRKSRWRYGQTNTRGVGAVRSVRTELREVDDEEVYSDFAGGYCGVLRWS
jgi:hypothetical protein